MKPILRERQSMAGEILIIEDDEVAREAIVRSVRSAKLSFNFVEKEDGLAALDYLREQAENDCEPPSIILLDLLMPQMNGLEFLEELESLGNLYPDYANVPVVSVTGCEDGTMAGMCKTFDCVVAVIRKFSSADILVPLISQLGNPEPV